MERKAGSVELHLAFRGVPGRALDVKSVLRDNQACYEAPGGVTVELLQSTLDQDSFLEIVRYADEFTYEADQARVASDPEMLARLRRWHSVIAGPPEVKIYRVIDLSG